MMLNEKNVIKLCVASLLFAAVILFSSSIFAKTEINKQLIAGNWQTLYDKTNKPSSIIAISKQGEFFEGKVIKTFRNPGEKQTGVCDSCVGAQKNKPILGMVIIKNMQCFSDYCKNGTILDPTNGKVYHASMHLFDHGLKLSVRGYVGIPLFGRSVVWHRAPNKIMVSSQQN